MSKPVCAVIGIGPKNGAAFARRFSREGLTLALVSRSTDFSQKLAAEIGDAQAYACDVADPEAIAQTFAAIRGDLGEVDVLIYNAGSGAWGNIEEIGVEGFERGWRVNALGAFAASQAVIPHMKQQQRGTIIFVGATASLRGKPFTTGFAPAKAAQRSLAQAMARHLGPKGIHVSVLIIDGGIGESDPSMDEETGSGPVSTQKQLRPEAIADAAVYLHGQHPSAWTHELDLRPMAESW